MHDYQALFEMAYQEYHRSSSKHSDPVYLVHPYAKTEDKEVVAFFAALLAYGNVTTILKSLRSFFGLLGPSPHDTLLNRKFGPWPEFKHRFTKGIDLEIVATWLSNLLHEHGSLEAVFLAESRTLTMKERLSAFVQKIHSQPLPKNLREVALQRQRNLKYLISDPNSGSACKRLNLFLRWVVRPADGIDLGIWRQVSTQDLMLPLDTHLLKVVRDLGWTEDKSATWRLVEAVTERLRQLDPKDPIRYDYSLCHLSMSRRSIKDYQIALG